MAIRGTAGVTVSVAAIKAITDALPDAGALSDLATILAAVDTEIAAILADTGTTLEARQALIKTAVDAILVDTGTTLPASLATLQTHILGPSGSWSNLNNEAINSLDLAIQYLAAMIGGNAANVFNPVVGGVARTNMDAVFTALDVVLQVIDANIDWVKEASGNDSWGFGALRNHILANKALIETVDENVDWIKEAAGNDTWGFGALKNLVDSLENVIGALNTAASTGAVSDAKATMAYIKQLVTELQVVDGIVDDILEDTATTLPATLATVAKQNRVLCSMDFWSASQEEVALTGAGGNKALPAVEVAEIPSGATIVRVIAMFKFRMIENHTYAGTNALEGATSIQVKETDAGSYTNAITFVDAQFGLAQVTREGGDFIIGTIDIASEVDANDGYSFQWTSAEAEETGINFNDVQMGLRVWYSL